MIVSTRLAMEVPWTLSRIRRENVICTVNGWCWRVTEKVGWTFALTSESTGDRNDGATKEEEEFCEFTVVDSGHRFMCGIEVTSKRTVCDTRRTWKTTDDDFGN